MTLYGVIRRNGLKRVAYDGIRSVRFYSMAEVSRETLPNNAKEELLRVANVVSGQKYDSLNLHGALVELQGNLSELKGESFNIVKTSLDQVKFHGSLESTRANLMLQLLLLDSTTEQSTIYKFIIKHLQHDLLYETLETFLYNLIANENLPAATILMHTLLNRLAGFSISNELWSLYISKVCDLSYAHGATMIYHELIDNYGHYDDNRTANITLENEYVPFLITNTLLEKLAWVFTHNKDSAKIQGILHYFKRFYSYHGHQETYKSLLFALVESYSYEEDMSNAIRSFKHMAFRFQGYLTASKKESADIMLKISAFNNFRWRRNNIKNNLSSNLYLPTELKNEKNVQEEIIAEAANIELFNPSMERNVYSSPQTKHIGIIKGKFSISDLPYFKCLVKKNVKQMMNSMPNHRVTQSINLITSSHYSIQPFVVSSLCELGYIREAFSIVLKLPSAYPNLSPLSLRSDECFISLFEACKNIGVDSDKLSTNQSIVDLCIEIKNYYLVSSRNSRLSSKVCSSFLSAIVDANNMTTDRFKIELDQIFQRDSNVILYLQDDEYEKFQYYATDYSQVRQAKFIQKNY